MSLTKEKALKIKAEIEEKSEGTFADWAWEEVIPKALNEAHKAGMKEALQSEAVKGLLDYANHSSFCSRPHLDCECGHYEAERRFNQFKEAQK